MGINKVSISGRLGLDPVLRPAAKEGSMLVMRLACHYSKATEWYTLMAFGKTAQYASKFARKGQELVVEGRLSAKTYKDSSGAEREGVVIIVSSIELGSLPQSAQQQGVDAPSHAAEQSMDINDVESVLNSSSVYEPR